MKTAAILVALLMVAGFACAADFEIDQGAIELGGSAGFSSYSGDLYENGNGDGITMFSFQPQALYFFTKGLGIGGSLGYQSQSQGDWSQSALGIGPSLQYYFGTDDSRIFPFLGVTFLYQSLKYKDEYLGYDPYGNLVTITEDVTNSMTSFTLSGGAAYKLADHYMVKGAVFYQMDSFKPDQGDNVSGGVMGLMIGFAGFIY